MNFKSQKRKTVELIFLQAEKFFDFCSNFPTSCSSILLIIVLMLALPSSAKAWPSWLTPKVKGGLDKETRRSLEEALKTIDHVRETFNDLPASLRSQLEPMLNRTLNQFDGVLQRAAEKAEHSMINVINQAAQQFSIESQQLIGAADAMLKNNIQTAKKSFEELIDHGYLKVEDLTDRLDTKLKENREAFFNDFNQSMSLINQLVQQQREGFIHDLDHSVEHMAEVSSLVIDVGLTRLNDNMESVLLLLDQKLKQNIDYGTAQGKVLIAAMGKEMRRGIGYFRLELEALSVKLKDESVEVVSFAGREYNKRLLETEQSAMNVISHFFNKGMMTSSDLLVILIKSLLIICLILTCYFIGIKSMSQDFVLQPISLCAIVLQILLTTFLFMHDDILDKLVAPASPTIEEKTEKVELKNSPNTYDTKE